MRTLRALGVLVALLFTAIPASARPNVLLVMTDDQGWGDLGVHGNTKVRTPHIDAFAREGVRFTRFYAGPVCTPTRASVMTGRYHLRTRAIDTYQGRAILHPDEVTLAEALGGAGYRTGIFGKWHLGDHYPSRATDQGFREALVHHGGGIAQPSDPPEGNSYFDPWLEHNGKPVKTSGYCSDVYTDAAIRFIDDAAKAREPFFAFLAFNAPHVPLQVSENLVRPYREAGLDDRTAKVYAMVENIDTNVGRVLAALAERKLADDTLVIFMTDNGPQTADRYNGVLRASKGSVYEGGIRVPCFLRWPAGFKGGREVDRVAAHIDLTPTILRACGVALPAGVKLDGTDLLPLLTGQAGAWPDRTLYFQWHRGDAAEAGRNCAAVTQTYKLVQPNGMGERPPGKTVAQKWELYDLQDDPGETRDLAAAHPEVVAQMRSGYDAWFADVSATRGYGPVPIQLGSDHENPVLLTRQDRRVDAGEGPGHWAVHVARAGTYRVTLLFDAADGARRASLRVGDVSLDADVPANVKEHAFEQVKLTAGDASLWAWTGDGGDKRAGVSYVRVEREQ